MKYDGSGNIQVAVAASDITAVGTITSGTWNGSVIDEVYGGTGKNSWDANSILYASAANTLAESPNLTFDGTSFQAAGLVLTPVLGSELITDAKNRTGFASTDWTGTNWSVVSNKLAHTATGANNCTLANTSMTSAPVVGHVYQLSFDIVTTTAGWMYPTVGGAPSVNDLTIGTHTGTITGYKSIVTAVTTAGLRLRADGNDTPGNPSWLGTIDNISCKEITGWTLVTVAGSSPGVVLATFSSAGAFTPTADIAMADGGTGASLTDPGADRVMFWDDTASTITWLTNGNGLTITDTTIVVDSASTTVDGIVELAIDSEVNAGSSASLAVTPDSLAASYAGTEKVPFNITYSASVPVAGDGVAATFRIPAHMNGMNLVDVGFRLDGADNATATVVALKKVAKTGAGTYAAAVDMLATNCTIDANEYDSVDGAAFALSATPANYAIATGDIIYPYIVSTGLVNLGLRGFALFRLP